MSASHCCIQSANCARSTTRTGALSSRKQLLVPTSPRSTYRRVFASLHTTRPPQSYCKKTSTNTEVCSINPFKGRLKYRFYVAVLISNNGTLISLHSIQRRIRRGWVGEEGAHLLHPELPTCSFHPSPH